MIEKSKVIFEYLAQKYIIQCRRDEKMKDIANRFKSKMELKSNNLIFLCHGNNLNLERTFNEEAKDDEKQNNEMIVTVHEGFNQINNSSYKVTKKSRDVICPICKENCRISIINYKIILYECKNGHKINNILLEDFNNSQIINESSIICDDCKDENKGSSFKKHFFKCLTCKKNLGALCNEKHKKEEHITIDYDKKDYTCEIHNDYFISYCQECKLNLCLSCYSEHNNNHNKIDYKIIIPNKKKINEQLIDLRKKIDEIKHFITDTIEKLKKVMEKLDIFYQINYDILNNNNFQNKNYQILQNINEISNNIEMSNIDKIINEKNISNKISELLKAYDKMVNKEENHDIIHKEEISKKVIPDKIHKKDKKDPLKPIKEYFIFPPLIGLQNIGAINNMNATLQCFCHIEKLVNYFRSSKHVIDITNKDKNSLTYSFKLLIEKLWPNDYEDPYFNEKNFAPKEFKEKISKLNPLFEGIAANDAKDLVNFIIKTLHKELNIKPINSKENENSMHLDQTNKEIMLRNFMKDFTLNNRSIISDLFYAMNYSETQCTNCNVQIYNYQIYFFLVFHLEEVRKYKSNNYQYDLINYNIYNELNIDDCFEYDRIVNLMSGENSMYCNYCRRNSNHLICTCLSTGPEILIILLNRGQINGFNIKINFPENLNLFNYIELKDTGYSYQLIGVISHIKSGMNGQFIAYCKDPISYLWHKYNDAMVNEVSDFQNEVINCSIPYLLLYQKIKE